MPTRRSVKGKRKATPPAHKTPSNVTTPAASATPAEKDAGEVAYEQERVLAQHKAARKKAKAAHKTHKKKHVSPVRVIVSCVCVVLVAALGVCAWFALDRWCLHDDAHDIQGTWFIYNTQVSIPITETTMGISDDAVYEYTIDTQAKTVTYSIGNLSGTSHYRFSPDRTQIALIEDGKRVFTATLFDDISWWTSHAGDLISGNEVLPGPVQSNVVLLTRQPSASESDDAGESDGAGEGDGAEAGESTETSENSTTSQGTETSESSSEGAVESSHAETSERSTSSTTNTANEANA